MILNIVLFATLEFAFNDDTLYNNFFYIVFNYFFI